MRSHFARKHASEAKCARTLHKIAPAKPWKRSCCPKLRRKSKMRSHAPRKHACEAKCAHTLHENTSAKQSAPAHSTKTRQRSRGNAPAAPNCTSEAKCARTLPEITPAKQSALARCPKLRWGGKILRRNAAARQTARLFTKRRTSGIKKSGSWCRTFRVRTGFPRHSAGKKKRPRTTRGRNHLAWLLYFSDVIRLVRALCTCIFGFAHPIREPYQVSAVSYRAFKNTLIVITDNI